MQVPVTILSVDTDKNTVVLSRRTLFDDPDATNDVAVAAVSKISSAEDLDAPALGDLPDAAALVLRRLATVDAVQSIQIDSMTVADDAPAAIPEVPSDTSVCHPASVVNMSLIAAVSLLPNRVEGH